MKPTLSILTPTIPSRLVDWEAYNVGDGYHGPALNLQERVERQLVDLSVEHLILCDNRARSIGAKRQALVDIARGEYIAFVDDDDDISDDYVSSLLEAARTGADVITFRQRAIYNGLESEVHFGIKNRDEQFNPGGITLRAPWHVCAWRREVVEGCLFGETNYGEDLIWCQQARQRIKTGFHVDRVLHTYRHDAKTTAAPEG